MTARAEKHRPLARYERVTAVGITHAPNTGFVDQVFSDGTCLVTLDDWVTVRVPLAILQRIPATPAAAEDKA